MTTCSPGFRPDVISVAPPAVIPVVTTRVSVGPPNLPLVATTTTVLPFCVDSARVGTWITSFFAFVAIASLGLLVLGVDGPLTRGTRQVVPAYVDAAMRSAARESSRYVTLGLAPLAGAVPRWQIGRAHV